MDIEESKTLERILNAIEIVMVGYYTAKNDPYDELRFAHEKISELISVMPNKITRKQIAFDLLKQPGGYPYKQWQEDNRQIFFEVAVELTKTRTQACELMHCCRGTVCYHQNKKSPSKLIDGL